MQLANEVRVTRSDNGYVLVQFAFVAISDEGGEEIDSVAAIEIPEQTLSSLNSQCTRLLSSAE